MKKRFLYIVLALSLVLFWGIFSSCSSTSEANVPEASDSTISWTESSNESSGQKNVDTPSAVVTETAREQEQPVVVTTSSVDDSNSALVWEFSYRGLDASLRAYTGKAILEYPTYITEKEIDYAIADVASKYSDLCNGMTYRTMSPGYAEITYPNSYGMEEFGIATELLGEELQLHIDSALGPIVKEDIALTETPSEVPLDTQPEKQPAKPQATESIPASAPTSVPAVVQQPTEKPASAPTSVPAVVQQPTEKPASAPSSSTTSSESNSTQSTSAVQTQTSSQKPVTQQVSTPSSDAKPEASSSTASNTSSTKKSLFSNTGLTTSTMVMILVGLLILAIYPLIFSFKFRRQYGVFPISGFGLLLQVATLIGLLFEIADDQSNNDTLMIILFAVSFVISIVLAIVKVSKAGGTGKDMFIAAWSQLMFFIYIIYILFKILSRPNRNHPPVN